MHGPAFPKNPVLADHLIQAALSRRYGAVTLDPLNDSAERTAHQRAADRSMAAPRWWKQLLGDGVG